VDELEQLRRFRAGDDAGPDEARADRARAVLHRAIADAGARAGTARRGRTTTRARALAAAVTAALGVGAALLIFGSGDRNDGGDAAQLSALFSAGGDASYEPAASPAELASMLQDYPDLKGQLVARGTVAGFADGRTYVYPDDPPATPTVVMQISVDEVLLGDLPSESDGSVYVEFDSTSGSGDGLAQAFEESIPKGTETVVYLAPVDGDGPYPGTKIENDGAGHPPGQPLFRIFSPQGLYLADPGTGDVIQPGESTVFAGASLDELEPSARAFPPSEFDADISINEASPQGDAKQPN
jgi:hypothetical protein